MPVPVSGLFRAQTERLPQPIPMCCEQTHLIIWPRVCVCVWWEFTVLLSAQALLAFGSGNEVRVADGLADVEVLLFGWHSFGRRAGQRGAFSLLDQALKIEDKISLKSWLNAPQFCKDLICYNQSEQTLCRVVRDLFLQQVKYWVRKSAGASNVGRCLSQGVSAVFSHIFQLMPFLARSN